MIIGVWREFDASAFKQGKTDGCLYQVQVQQKVEGCAPAQANPDHLPASSGAGVLQLQDVGCMAFAWGCARFGEFLRSSLLLGRLVRALVECTVQALSHFVKGDDPICEVLEPERGQGIEHMLDSLAPLAPDRHQKPKGRKQRTFC